MSHKLYGLVPDRPDIIGTGYFPLYVYLPAQGGPTMKIPPIDFLLVCSGVSLRDFELNRLNQAANLRKHIREIADQMCQAEAEAIFARWLMEHRDVILSAGRPNALQASFEFPALCAMSAGAPPRAARRKSSSPSRKEICA